jgi:hypothetical protein
VPSFALRTSAVPRVFVSVLAVVSELAWPPSRIGDRDGDATTRPSGYEVDSARSNAMRFNSSSRDSSNSTAE